MQRIAMRRGKFEYQEIQRNFSTLVFKMQTWQTQSFNTSWVRKYN